MQSHILKSGENLNIKLAEPSDASRILQFCKKVGRETNYLSYGEGEFDKSLQEQEQELIRYKEADNQLFIYGELNDNIVGLLDVKSSSRPRIRHSCEFGISVLKAHWGKGIAGCMLDYMFEWAKNNEYIRKINLHVISNNDSAINLYRKYDFTMEGRISKEFYVNGQYVDKISMGLWLD